MGDHVHTGFPHFLFAGLSAIVLIQLLRFAAAQMVTRPGLEGAGKAVGALVSFN